LIPVVRGVLIAACVLFPVAASSAVVQYSAPAGNLPAGHFRSATYDAVLPSGRLVTPEGASVVVGMNALGFALSPDGRYAIVSNDDERQDKVHSAVDPLMFGGYSLTVVDTATMAVVDRYRAFNEPFFTGIVALPDPRNATRTLVLASGGPSNIVYALSLDTNGHLTADATHIIAIPSPGDPLFADLGHAFPGTLVISHDGRRVYVVNEGGNTVCAIDPARRAVTVAPQAVGFFPSAAAIAGDRLLVANEGLMRYARTTDQAAPPFHTPAADLQHASSLSLVALGADGELSTTAANSLPMDPAPDGTITIGGAHPSAIAVSPDGAYAYIAMTNVDRIATVALAGTPHVAGGTELRLFDRGPYGTQPDALAISKDGSRLYVALAGLNAVAVIDAHDPVHLHRLGLIPTGWYPTAIALSADERTLYVTNAKGFGHDAGFTGDPAIGADANAVWSTLEKIDLAHVRIGSTTLTTLKNTRVISGAKAPAYPKALTNVVVILQEDKTFDSMLGDLGYGPADPGLTAFGEAVTPNLHALARRYAVAGNMFSDAEESDAGHQFAQGGIATTYTEKTLTVKSGRRPLVNASQDPENYPRLGYIFNNLARHKISFRDYGDLVRLAGYDEGGAPDPKVDDPSFVDPADLLAPTHGLGGRYSLDVPALAALTGRIDLNYPGVNPRIRDERRARDFIRDYSLFVRSHKQPRYTSIALSSPDVADNDRALGEIVQYLTHLASWKNTVIFVMPASSQNARDHIDEYRTYAIAVSPYAKRKFVGMHHLSTVSILKTTEQLFGLPPLALGDLLATGMPDFFTQKPADTRPYTVTAAPVNPH
jgi:DNA-binding beta-propeller fold protein YncE